MKDEKVFVRMPTALRDQITQEARLRGEAESVIIREALRRYFDGSTSREALNDAPQKEALTIITQ